ncbi:RDD family protein [Anthocerotibacter panamensis]|uniref:RDD family protein n=1 Tax=Anthocerotibacter panamensis TaxID=2857077 RepID=UPI001C4061CC|nr:RDD family protein [Anthocerotibacter panamensis]
MGFVKAGFYTIRTPENIELTFRLAGLGERVLAQMVDAFLNFSLNLALWLIFGLLSLAITRSAQVNVSGLGDWVFALGILSTTCINLGYYLYFETRWQGQTPGKRWSQLRVLRDDGRPLDVQAALVRNLVRLVDQTLFLGLFVMLLNAREKRLGDMAAGTIVIKESTTATLTIPAVAAPVTVPNPLLNISRIKPQDFTYLAEFLSRKGMEPKARKQVAERLATRYLTLLGEPVLPPSLTAEQFLALVYNAYTHPSEDNR